MHARPLGCVPGRWAVSPSASRTVSALVSIMTCKHIKELYEICESHSITLSSTDLIRIVCPQCGEEEVCPSVLCEEYESRHEESGETDEPPKE